MLHEVLLALSGHPSPLCSQDAASTSDFLHVSAAEKALLATVGHLGELHRAAKTHLLRVRREHPSVICKSVANDVLTIQLKRFQQHIEIVERKILIKDATSVGAYNIVPLASVVQEFDIWRRRLEWYWDLACFIFPVDRAHTNSNALGEVCSGPALINKLRREICTGYDDIGVSASALLAVAERAFMRQLSCWLITSKLADHGKDDFFVQSRIHENHQQTEHFLATSLIPSSITAETAQSVLFIGKTLNMIQPMLQRSSIAPSGSSRTPDSSLTSINSNNLRHLRAVTFPIKPVVLAHAVSQIRKDLSQMLGDTVLPIHVLLQTLVHVRSYLLIGQPEFTDQLIDEADNHINTRHLQTRTSARTKEATDLAGIIMKQSEITTVMSRTWAAIASSMGKGDMAEDQTEWARENLALGLTQVPDSAGPRQQIAIDTGNTSRYTLHGKFDDFLLATPVMLKLQLDSSFDLFISPVDRQAYSTIHTYLLAIRRAHNHASRLWRQGSLRKAAKTSHGPRVTERSRKMRSLWATGSMTVATLAKIGSFFADEVITPSWDAFRTWAGQATNKDRPRDAVEHSTIRSALDANSESMRSARIGSEETHGLEKDTHLPHDPETIARAHQQYLSVLTRSLLLTDDTWTRTFRNFLTYVDQMVAFVERLRLAQQHADLYSHSTDEQLSTKYNREEDFLFEEARKSCRRIEDVMQRLAEHLQQTRLPELAKTEISVAGTGFEPWQPGNAGIERLLLRLDMRVAEAEPE